MLFFKGTFISVLQEKVGNDTLLLYHTAAFPAPGKLSTSDLVQHARLGRKAYYHQLNAATKQVKFLKIAPIFKNEIRPVDRTVMASF